MKQSWYPWPVVVEVEVEVEVDRPAQALRTARRGIAPCWGLWLNEQGRPKRRCHTSTVHTLGHYLSLDLGYRERQRGVKVHPEGETRRSGRAARGARKKLDRYIQREGERERKKEEEGRAQPFDSTHQLSSLALV